MSRPSIISTMKPLPFDDLEPAEFERMTLSLVEREGYQGVRHLGLGGSEQGRDIVGYKATESGDELWYFQCKRYKRINASTLKKEIDKYVELTESDASKQPSGIVFVTNAKVTARVSDAVEKYSRDRGFRIEFWARTELDSRVNKYPDIVRRFFHAAAPAVSFSPERSELLLLLGIVEDACLREGLDTSVPESRRIALELEEQPGAVEPRFVAWQKTPAARSLPPGQTVVDLFLKRSRSLLILGDTGSGKTTTLLLLAQGLAARAGPGPEEPPIPVVLNLSTWAAQPLLLKDWLVQAMKKTYLAPEKATPAWLDEHKILPLLDGLDEVESDDCRAACVDAINEWLEQDGNGLHGLAVCCSTEAHKKLLELPQPRRLKLATAVSVQTLSTAKIGEYLALAPGGKALGAVLEGDPELKELAKNPQLLDIMREICEDAGGEALAESAEGPLEVRSRRLFEKYVDLRLELRKSRRFSRKRTLHDLTWLAKGMKEHSSSLFGLEQLQPSWLSGPARWTYFLATRILGSLLLVLPVALWRESPLLLAFGLAAGALAGGVDGAGWRGRLSPSARTAVFAAVILLLFLAGGFVFTDSSKDKDVIRGAALFTLLFGLTLGLRSARRIGSRDDVQVAEVLPWSGWSWSWAGAWKGALAGPFAGAVMWTVNEIDQGAPLRWELAFGVTIFFLVGIVAGGFVGGLRRGISEKKIRPNEGIRLTLKYAGMVALLAAVAIALAAAPLAFGSRTIGWQHSLLWGATFGFWVGLGYGGLDVLQHYVLRILLALSKYAPVRYVPFLQYAADSGLLLKMGGSYRFRYGPMQGILAARPQGEPAPQSLGIARSASS